MNKMEIVPHEERVYIDNGEQFLVRQIQSHEDLQVVSFNLLTFIMLEPLLMVLGLSQVR